MYSNNAHLLDYSYELYKKLPAKPEYEKWLHELYKKDIEALMALARYKKDEDKQTIMRYLTEATTKDYYQYSDTLRAAFNAIEVWPDKSFAPLVQENCENILIKSDKCISGITDAIGVLFAYNEPWCYKLMEKALENENNPYIEFDFEDVYRRYYSIGNQACLECRSYYADFCVSRCKLAHLC